MEGLCRIEQQVAPTFASLSSLFAPTQNVRNRDKACLQALVVAGAGAMQDSTFLQYLPDGSCKSMIYEYQKLAAQDVRFDVPLADACMDDRMKLCGNVQPVSEP